MTSATYRAIIAWGQSVPARAKIIEKNPPVFTSRFTDMDSNKVIQGTSVIISVIFSGTIRIALL